MTASYRITEDAKRDLRDIAHHIALDSLRSAERFMERAGESFETLADMPGMGTTHRFSRSTLKGIRRFPVKQFDDYLIFYRAIDGEFPIEIVRVVHGARDLPTLFNDQEE